MNSPGVPRIFVINEVRNPARFEFSDTLGCPLEYSMKTEVDGGDEKNL
jgi:hypothetical protein